MKKTKLLLSITIALAMHFVCFAQADNDNDNDHKKKYDFVKTKTISKTYSVAGGNKLDISNSFGKVEVHTWNKNEIRVEVNVEVSANKEASAVKLLDGINISEKQSGNEVSFKTNINTHNNGKNEKSSMEVNYNIYMPETNELEVVNEFGPTIIPDFKGRVNLHNKFGPLTTGDLPDAKNITVEFSKGDFGNIANGNISIKFSSANFKRLTGNTKLSFEFCSASKVSIDNGLTALDLNASYSTVNLRPSGGLPASYTINTSFGNFKNNTGIKFSSDEEEENNGPKFDFKYEGKSGSGNIPVKIKTSFGKVILGEASEEDMKEEGKEKQKQKRKTT